MVSSDGNVFSHKRSIILKLRTDKDGYKRVSIFNNEGRRVLIGVHKLVLLAFVGEEPNKKIAHHINNISHDNRLDNLMWVTVSENTKHGYDIGASKSAMSISVGLYYKGQLVSYFDSFNKLAKSLKVNRNTLRRAYYNKDGILFNTFEIRTEPIIAGSPLNKEIFEYQVMRQPNKPFRLISEDEIHYFYTCNEMCKAFNITNSQAQRCRSKGVFGKYILEDIDSYEYYKHTH